MIKIKNLDDCIIMRNKIDVELTQLFENYTRDEINNKKTNITVFIFIK